MSINWHTTSQGPKKKSIKITKQIIDPCPAHTARNKGSFTTMVLWTVQRFLSSTVCIYHRSGKAVKGVYVEKSKKIMIKKLILTKCLPW